MSTPTVWKTKLAPEDIRPGDCKARSMSHLHRLPSTPYIYLESQCIRTPLAGGDLCALHKKWQEAYAALPSNATTRLKNDTCWSGRVTEPAMDWVHVMGTKWAEPVFRRWRNKQAAEEKARAVKEAEAAAKAAEAAAKKAAPVAVGGAGGPPPEENEIEGELALIDGTFYIVKNGNVYEYDEIAETTGDFVGRLKADGESIDTEAEEEDDVVVLEPPAPAPAPAPAANAVKETANAIAPAVAVVEHPSFEDLLGHLGMVEMAMDSTRSAAYKLIRLTEFLTVCSKPDYAPFWRTDFDGRHRMRTNLIVWKEFGVCAAADTFLAMYPA